MPLKIQCPVSGPLKKKKLTNKNRWKWRLRWLSLELGLREETNGLTIWHLLILRFEGGRICLRSKPGLGSWPGWGWGFQTYLKPIQAPWISKAWTISPQQAPWPDSQHVRRQMGWRPDACKHVCLLRHEQRLRMSHRAQVPAWKFCFILFLRVPCLGSSPRPLQ